MNEIDKHKQTLKKHKIMLNDILHLEDLSNVVIRLNISGSVYNAIEKYHNDKDGLLLGNFYNSSKRKWFKEGQIVIGLAQISGKDWLLFDISRITKDYNRLGKPDVKKISYFYDREVLKEYEKYFGRLVVKFHKNNAYVKVNGKRLETDFEVKEILSDDLTEKEKFVGYENVDLSWSDLKRVLKLEDWRTALENQKGVYLITDIKTNKRYVGSAYGENMMLGRWKHYAESGHGGNKDLKKLVEEKGIEYIKNNFRYSILDIYKAKTDDKIIIKREHWWGKILLTDSKTGFGYNMNLGKVNFDQS